MTSTYKTNIETAIPTGQWDVVYDEASCWSEQADCGPLPFFAVNVVCLLRGDFAQAWRVHPQALGEEADVQLVREWMVLVEVSGLRLLKFIYNAVKKYSPSVARRLMS